MLVHVTLDLKPEIIFRIKSLSPSSGIIKHPTLLILLLDSCSSCYIIYPDNYNSVLYEAVWYNMIQCYIV